MRREAVTAMVWAVTFDLLRELGMTTIFGNPGSAGLSSLRGAPQDLRHALGSGRRRSSGCPKVMRGGRSAR